MANSSFGVAMQAWLLQDMVNEYANRNAVNG